MIKTVEKVIKQLCLDCVTIVKSNKKCPKCDKKAAVIKATRGYKYVLVFEGRELIYTPRMIKSLFSQLSMESIQQLGMQIHPESMILENVYISPIMTRPDKKIQASIV
jgi:DNA-directed RNA polymerase beta' subunit